MRASGQTGGSEVHFKERQKQFYDRFRRPRLFMDDVIGAVAVSLFNLLHLLKTACFVCLRV